MPHFCEYQMLMKDRMHAIDLGVILTLIKAMMRKYYECVEIFMDNEAARGTGPKRCSLAIPFFVFGP